MAITYKPAGQGAYVESLAKQAASAAGARIRQQQEFALQLKQLDQQLELDRFARQKSWETEKMELASRLDFERSEKKRLAELDEVDARIKAVVDAVDQGLIDVDEADREKTKIKLKAMLNMEAMGDTLVAKKIADDLFPKYRFPSGGAPGTQGQAPTEAPQQAPMKILGSGQVGGQTKYQLQVPMGEYTDVINVDPTDQLVVRDPSGNQAVVSMQEYQDQYQKLGWVVDSLSPQVAQKVQTRKTKIMPTTPVERGQEALRRGAGGVPGLFQAVGGKVLSAFERGAPPTQTPFAGPPSIPHEKIRSAIYGAFPEQGDIGEYVKKDWDRFVRTITNDPTLSAIGIKKEKLENRMKRWTYMTEEQIKQQEEFKKLPDRLKNYVLNNVKEFQSGFPKFEAR